MTDIDDLHRANNTKNRRTYRHESLRCRMILAGFTEARHSEVDTFELVADDVARGHCCETPADCWRDIAYGLADEAAQHRAEMGRDEAIADLEKTIAFCLGEIAKLDGADTA